jgi:hypothetical protein
MTHVKGDTIRIYLPAEYVRRLYILKKSGKIKNVSAFFREKLMEEAGKVDPREELRKIEEEKKQLDEREKVWQQCVHTDRARFDDLLDFLERYREYRHFPKTPEQIKDWLSGYEVELRGIFGDMDIDDCTKILDSLRVIPNLTQTEAEKLIGGSLI